MKNSAEHPHGGIERSYIDLASGVEGASREPCGTRRGTGGAGDAPRPPVAAGGRREAPTLDLSLGHFGTSPVEEEVDFVFDGPFVVELDYGAMVVTVSQDRVNQFSRATRRTSARKIEKLLATAQRTCMKIVREAP